MEYKSLKRFNIGQIFKMSFLNVFIAFFALQSCGYLDIVPDDIPTIEYAFRNRNEAENFLYGCLSFMPEPGRMSQNPALLGSDEIFVHETVPGTINRRILLGYQNSDSPYADYYAEGGSPYFAGKALWRGIADCNIFLENVHLPFDLKENERKRWTGEAIFAKAYMYFWLFRQYGPIPILKSNIPIGADAQVYREPVDDVVDYIVGLLDEATELLPNFIQNTTDEWGRPTKVIAKALKAQTLMLAASPLFNCNTDLANYGDDRGVYLFPQDKSVEKQKWEKAAQALKEAIEAAESERYRLYDAHLDFPQANFLSEQTVLAMQVRGAVVERPNQNPEKIWGDAGGNEQLQLQQYCQPVFEPNQMSGAGSKAWGVPLHIVKQFYTKNGIPIEDDEEWVGRDIWEMRYPNENVPEEKYWFQRGYRTANLHFDREARFHSSVFFDGCTYLGNGKMMDEDPATGLWNDPLRFSSAGLNGWSFDNRSHVTGYLCKKLLHYNTASRPNAMTQYYYAFPIIRLADLYLLYAEALNECKEAPDAEVYEYIDKVRERTGLKGVVESWSQHAIADRKNLPLSKEGMREIIQRERLIELAFEGQRYWDLRRWKLAKTYLDNMDIEGLDVMKTNLVEFYTETLLFTVKFEDKDYFSPIRTHYMRQNRNLLQSPGW